jgi:hypothetical protein
MSLFQAIDYSPCPLLLGEIGQISTIVKIRATRGLSLHFLVFILWPRLQRFAKNEY